MSIHFPDVPATYRNVPKNGGTSFKFWCRKYIRNKIELQDPNSPDQIPTTPYPEMVALWPNHGTTFGFVRNPYDRLVSIFHFLGQDAKKRIKKRSLNPTFEDAIKFPIEVDLKILFQYNRGFNDWILNGRTDSGHMLLSNKDVDTQMHYFTQIKPDIVIKLEEMETEFVQIQNLLNCHEPFMHVNTSKHGHYTEYYTDDTRKIAYRWLEEDLDAFGYTY